MVSLCIAALNRPAKSTLRGLLALTNFRCHGQRPHDTAAVRPFWICAEVLGLR